jgi:uncharacterized SAM-binding protein YcdF (DUF218 family)
MLFILSKTAAFVFLPSNFLIIVCLVGLLLTATRFRRTGKAMTIGGVVLLAVLGFSPLGAMLGHKLESRFPPWDASRGAPDGIVVLGGAISPALSRDFGGTQVNGNAGRVMAMLTLARAYPNARIIYSGGDASLRGNGLAEADYVYPLLDSFGISRDRVTLESQARNTVENAQFSKALAKAKPGERWLLVTSAVHMPRAIGCFRQAGFAVEAYPTAWHTRKRLRFFIVDVLGGGLARLDNATHEWMGLIAYWLTGRTSEFLPGAAAAE